MSKLPPTPILNEFMATAIVELKEDYIRNGPREFTYLGKGTKGWTDMMWGDIEADWIDPDSAVHPQFGSGIVRFYWMEEGSGVANVISTYTDKLKIISKLPQWKTIAENGTRIRS